MKNKELMILVCIFLFASLNCNNTTFHPQQLSGEQLEKIRINNGLPGLAVALFSSDSVYQVIYSGNKKLGTTDLLNASSRFHLGSNTKAFIGFAAASLVEDGLITYDTKFFDVCPEYKELADGSYHGITLEKLLHHEAGLTSKDEEFFEIMLPHMEDDTIIDRYRLFQWAFSKDRFKDGYQYSNTGYVMAACMLEKKSGKGWFSILQERILEPLQITASVGWPNQEDSSQTWGHYTDPESGSLHTHPPEDPYKLRRYGFGPAGDLNMKVDEYLIFLQDNLAGYRKTGGILPEEAYQQMHPKGKYGLGWGYVESINGKKNISMHSGSAGTFYCQAILFRNDDLGIAFFTNCYPQNTQEIAHQIVDQILIR